MLNVISCVRQCYDVGRYRFSFTISFFGLNRKFVRTWTWAMVAVVCVWGLTYWMRTVKSTICAKMRSVLLDAVWRLFDHIAHAFTAKTKFSSFLYYFVVTNVTDCPSLEHWTVTFSIRYTIDLNQFNRTTCILGYEKCTSCAKPKPKRNKKKWSKGRKREKKTMSVKRYCTVNEPWDVMLSEERKTQTMPFRTQQLNIFKCNRTTKGKENVLKIQKIYSWNFRGREWDRMYILLW